MPQEKWFALINPVSGFGKAEKKRKAIEAELKRQHIAFDFRFTTATAHADVLIQEEIQNGFRKFICVGGDGNLHDMVNGIMRQNTVPSTAITLAMISLGTGNDWIKTSGVPKDIRGAIALIKQERTMLQNAGAATCFLNGKETTTYFHNFAGVGFDAYVVARTTSLKTYGQAAYLLGMLKCLFTYQKPVLKITVDDEVLETVCYLTLAGIGKYGGGGMKLTPGAALDGDGFFVSIAKNFSRLDVFRHIAKLYNGKFIHLPEAETRFAKKIRIELLSATQEVFMEADGDLLGTGPFEISMLPKALRVVIP